jgi:hypothetical protein
MQGAGSGAGSVREPLPPARTLLGIFGWVKAQLTIKLTTVWDCHSVAKL